MFTKLLRLQCAYIIPAIGYWRVRYPRITAHSPPGENSSAATFTTDHAHPWIVLGSPMLRFLCLDLLDVVWCVDFSIVRVRNTIWKDRVKSQQAL